MKLRKEYRDIVDREIAVYFESENTTGDVAQNVALACQELADRPPRELSDAEKRKVWESVWDGRFDTTVCRDSVEVVDKIIAAFLAKQREPETVRLRVARHKSNGKIQAVQGDYINDDWEWLEPAQEFEVKV